MSNRYKGGIISATPPTTSKASASGAWTLEQQMQAQGADAWPYAGPTYIEDVFSTWLYTGNSSTQTITNGVDLSSYGGLVWTKCRSGVNGNWLWDTARGVDQGFQSNSINASSSLPGEGLTAFNANGFTLGNNVNWNQSGSTFASWTFRKQPKFFDIVTFTTGAGTNLVIPHSLGSVPGCVIIKNTAQADNWYMYHRGLTSIDYKIYLNTTAAQTTGGAGTGAITAISSTTFTIRGAGLANNNTHVAYVFAHDAGGFGLAGTDNVISCGSYTGNGSATGPIVTLGYEPQWVLIKNASDVGNWVMSDNMRNWSVTNAAILYANLTNSEATNTITKPLATGFQPNDTSSSVNTSGATYIYIAIRRGPMKVPTSGATVFAPVARTGTGAVASITAGFPVDLEISKTRPIANPSAWFDRLRGANLWLRPSGTGTEGETTGTGTLTGWDSNTGVTVGADASDGLINFGSRTYANWMFRRAPGFFDTVCYTGTGANATRPHNLGVVPEMMIVKKRSTTSNWAVYHSALGADGYVLLNTTAASTTSSTFWQSTTPTSTNFYTGTNGNVGDSGQTYVAYLFATLAGVSKVGSYTGNGSSQTIACGFTAGARFILIKRTDSTGDWYVWDTALGIVAGNDPHLSLNATAGEVTTDDTIDPDNTGFIVNQVAATNVNVTSATYIFLAIA